MTDLPPKEERHTPQALSHTWHYLSKSQFQDLAASWLASKTERSAPTPADMKVVWMGFTAPLDQQELFLREAISQADSPEDFGQIGAGPLECILVRFGCEAQQMVNSVLEEYSDLKFALAEVNLDALGVEAKDYIKRLLPPN